MSEKNAIKTIINGEQNVEQITSIEEHKIRIPKELPYLFEKELYNKANKNSITILSNYIPTEKVIPIEGKFYSKYDQNWTNLLNLTKYCELNKHLNRTPMEKFTMPLIASHHYGWMPQIERKQFNYLNRINAPKLHCDLTIYAEKLNNTKITERSKYQGEKFFLY